MKTKPDIHSLMNQIAQWRIEKLQELRDHERLEMSRENLKSIFSIQDFP